MKKDIQFLPVENVVMTIIPAEDSDLWQVHLINRNDNAMETLLITSKGYGEQKGKKQDTSVLRHSIPKLQGKSTALIESISPDVFHLTNEYWVSFYIGNQIYDKKYIFLPDSLIRENLVDIPELNGKGVLHE